VVVISVTGAALVFRIDLQRAAYPHLFTPRAVGPLADPLTIMDSVSRAYPDQRLSGVDAPTTGRPTYLAYVTTPGSFTTVLIDPVSAEVLGELPEKSWIRSLQDLHYDLLGGRTGRMINGAGAAAILVMCVTGVVIWWPGRKAWWRALTIDVSRRGPRLLWEIHRAAGIWTVLLIVMWATTGVYFAFPAQARAIVGALSPLTTSRSPSSQPPPGGVTTPGWRAMIDNARRLHPDGHVARVVLPIGERGSFLVMFASRSPTPTRETLEPVYLDRFTGQQLMAESPAPSMGDVIVRWIAPLHIGTFGGGVVRAIWFMAGLIPAVLFVTGSAVWWNRLSRRRAS
jgi:uncharacterized iron-regulated membrane protein